MNLFSSRRPLGHVSARRTRSRPRVEILEDRLTPSTLHVGSSAGEFHTIQAAVNAANPGDTILVDPGTYQEQVTVFQNTNGVTLNNLKLKSSSSLAAVIQAPTALTGAGAIVEVSGATNVTINGFTIQGPDGGSNTLNDGILVDNAGSATITGNHITRIEDNPLNGNQTGIGIEVGGSTTGTATISGNTVDDYQKTGIEVDNTHSSATIKNNTVTGVGPTAAIAQNGIQIGFGATGTISGNTISENIYTPQTFDATGILLFQSGRVSVTGNTISNNDDGVWASTVRGVTINNNNITGSTWDAILLETATGSTVNGNTLTGNGSGGVGDGGIELISSSAGNTLRNNQSNRNNGDGVFVDASSGGNTFTDNHMTGNRLLDAQDNTRGTGSAGTADTWRNNVGRTSNPPGLFS
jgi:parallel beta-helix repeat protein